MIDYKFGERSEKELVGVHPRLVLVVRRALVLSTVDFGVTDGLRTIEEQTEYVRTGASDTMKSMHLKQLDGFGHAVDLAGYVNGKPRWEWPIVFQVTDAMRRAALEMNEKIIWGGVWDRLLNELRGDLSVCVDQYEARHPGRDFIDGPHFQLA